MRCVKITTDYITLGQFLKFIGLINNGGEAKIAVKILKISINDCPEDRRGCKIYPGDKVKVDKNCYFVEN
ncbi:MAG: RNA-binding S4 domain-containing protein [Bacilli bacterium]|nr:RNA-binding S4 domain-containing protein [Bacilli bacterium]